ncbi:MAG: urocanate hydratase [Candidatus Hodarchaeales archaeon]
MGSKKQTRLSEIMSGNVKLPKEELLRLDLRPENIPPLPSGVEALTPTTKAGWQTEAIKRAIISNLHNGSDWKTLFIYGGSGKNLRNWKAFYDTLQLLDELESNETLFMQSGVPYGKMLTHPLAPRCVITNSIIVPNWTQYFQEMVDAGLTVYGQMTAGSWIFIGLQGIIQGTYETVAEAIRVTEARPQYNQLDSLEKKLVVSAGLGLMSGAQPLAFKMNKKIALIAEINPAQIDRMYNEGRDRGTPYLDHQVTSIEEGIALAKEYAARDEVTSIGIRCNAVDLLQYLIDHNITPLCLTDQTSAHDMLNGYVPQNMTYEEALKLRDTDSHEYVRLARETCVRHVKQMIELQKRGAETFDYGNNLRGEAFENDLTEAFSFPGFVVAYIRPLFCEGKGPFRWEALSNDPEDIRTTDDYALKLFHDDERLINWIKLASEYIPFEKGLPARVFWAGFFWRAAFGMLMNKLVADQILKAPIAIGRDHLDGGSVASPRRETEGMKDGSDAIGDYAVLNLIGNTLGGATWVSMHQGGGVGIKNSLHAGQVIVADGTRIAQEKLFRVLMWDPLSAILRHSQAGYESAQEVAKQFGVIVPGTEGTPSSQDYLGWYQRIIDIVKQRVGIELWPPLERFELELL